MKLHEQKIEVEESSTISSDQFGISQEDQPMILHILRSQLYSDKILAPIREYTANGIDANLEAGSDKPVKVTIPSLLNNEFRVRDFGFGLSEDQIYNVFSKYGRSTKRDNNDMIGGLGIGSKSAFAYTDLFHIISYYDGKKYYYTAHIDETKKGKISLKSVVPTTEPSGLEISFGVRTPDIENFKQTAIKYFSFFKPGLVEVNVPISTIKYSLEGSFWRVIDIASLPYQLNTFANRASVRMGHINYPLQVEFLTDITKDIEPFLSLPIVIDLPIGSVSIAANREALEYIESTRMALYKYLKAIKHELSQELEKKFASYKLDTWSICKRANTLLSSDIKFGGAIAETILVDYIKKTYPTFNNHSTLQGIMNAKKVITLCTKEDEEGYSVKTISSNQIESWRQSYYSRTLPGLLDKQKNKVQMTIGSYVVFKPKDLQEPNKRLYGLVTTEVSKLPLHTANNYNSIAQLTIFESPFVDGAEYLAWKKEIIQQLVPGTPTIELSGVAPAAIAETVTNTNTVATVPVRISTGPSAYAKAKVLKYDLKKQTYTPEEIDDSDENLLIGVRNKNPLSFEDTSKDITSELRVLAALDECLGETTNIYAIKAAEVERFKKNYKYKKLEDTIKEKMEKINDNLTEEEQIYLWLNFNRNSSTYKEFLYKIVYNGKYYLATQQKAITKTKDDIEKLIKEIPEESIYTTKLNKLIAALDIYLATIKIAGNEKYIDKFKFLVERTIGDDLLKVLSFKKPDDIIELLDELATDHFFAILAEEFGTPFTSNNTTNVEKIKFLSTLI